MAYSVVQADSEARQAYLDGREPTLLVDTPDLWVGVGTWAPDGRRFFFTGSAPNKRLGMYIYDESTGEITQVSKEGESAGVPSFSRDGKTMAWWSSRRTSTQTWIMEDFLPESDTRK